jgi:hypothetical protein
MNNESDPRRWGAAIQIAGVLSLLLALIHSGREVVESIADGPVGADGSLGLFNAGLIGLIHAMPYLLLLSGLGAMARLGAAYQRGEVFSLANAHLIRRFGASLIAAAAAFLVLRPTLLDWVGGVARGFVFRIDDAGLAMIAAGVFVTAMAQVMALATSLQAENDSFV